MIVQPDNFHVMLTPFGRWKQGTWSLLCKSEENFFYTIAHPADWEKTCSLEQDSHSSTNNNFLTVDNQFIFIIGHFSESNLGFCSRYLGGLRDLTWQKCISHSMFWLVDSLSWDHSRSSCDFASSSSPVAIHLPKEDREGKHQADFFMCQIRQWWSSHLGTSHWLEQSHGLPNRDTGKNRWVGSWPTCHRGSA